jgi:LacI family transcriptional regulator
VLQTLSINLVTLLDYHTRHGASPFIPPFRLELMRKCPSKQVIRQNDFTPVHVMKSLQNKNTAIFVVIAGGFNNAPELRIVEPHLSTIHSDEIGINAANILLSLVKEPKLSYQVTHIQTKSIFRASTS